MPLAVRVKDFMAEKVESVDASDPVSKAVSVMVQKGIGSVLVNDNGKPVGLLTERDIMEKVCPRNLCASGAKVKEFMTAPLITVRSDATIGEAAKLMVERDVRRLPVMDDGRLVGIITQNDVLKETLNAFMTIMAL